MRFERRLHEPGIKRHFNRTMEGFPPMARSVDPKAVKVGDEVLVHMGYNYAGEEQWRAMRVTANDDTHDDKPVIDGRVTWSNERGTQKGDSVWAYHDQIVGLVEK